jgi:hypothetical protein
MKLKNNTQLILDFAISGLFVLLSMILMKYLIPPGNITIFLSRGSKLVALACIPLITLFLISWFFNKSFKFKNKICLPNSKDLFLIALPMSPVINYALINHQYLVPSGLLYLAGIPLIFILFFSYIIPIVFSYFGSIKILMISGLSLSFTVMNIAQIFNNPEDQILNSLLITQGIYLIASFTLIYLLYLINKKTAYVAVFFFMATGIVSNYFNYFSNNLVETRQPDRLVKFLNNKKNTIVNKKNIYLIVYESYANSETLRYYGFDNTRQIKFLENNGFTVYKGIYSNASASLTTTSRILEVNGNLSELERYYTSGNAFGLDIFKANGYKTVGLFKSPYFFGSFPIKWDDYYPKESVTKMGGSTITKGIFEGHFKFDIFDDSYDYKRYLELKNKYLSSINKNTLFYTHNGYPGHSGNSGKCASNEKQLYFERMKKANIEMKNDVSNILKNDSDSIIVLLSDHGPYLTKNCRNLNKKKIDLMTIDKYDIQDRYGTFFSIYWPNDIKEIKRDLIITQDIFPAILSSITNNKDLFNELKVERKFFDEIGWSIGGINVINGIIKGGKYDGVPLFENRSYSLAN